MVEPALLKVMGLEEGWDLDISMVSGTSLKNLFKFAENKNVKRTEPDGWGPFRGPGSICVTAP